MGESPITNQMEFKITISFPTFDLIPSSAKSGVFESHSGRKVHCKSDFVCDSIFVLHRKWLGLLLNAERKRMRLIHLQHSISDSQLARIDTSRIGGHTVQIEYQIVIVQCSLINICWCWCRHRVHSIWLQQCVPNPHTNWQLWTARILNAAMGHLHTVAGSIQYAETVQWVCIGSHLDGRALWCVGVVHAKCELFCVRIVSGCYHKRTQHVTHYYERQICFSIWHARRRRRWRWCFTQWKFDKSPSDTPTMCIPIMHDNNFV